ncbi:LPS translocon maturation chaperone LptM [Acidithiobacillus sp. M4-SHS-6]|uniref:LPS translocon maturation chaperone LptM n=1 Tax=Acidithiobacillus sp. M4-SHS-6 TaxID=3383024 RepID=UPI0039BE4F0B
MKRLAEWGLWCLLLIGLAGCGRKTPLTLPPPPAEHPAASAAATPAPAQGSPDSTATGSGAHP